MAAKPTWTDYEVAMLLQAQMIARKAGEPLERECRDTADLFAIHALYRDRAIFRGRLKAFVRRVNRRQLEGLGK
jgi:hypothetical protein